MGILSSAKPVLIVCTRDRERAAKFYRATLGLQMTGEDQFATIFDAGGNPLRLSTVPDFTPHEHAILGFTVPDVRAAVKSLREAGVVFNIYKGFNQDESGIMTLPDGVQVAWFKDPDGNVLSVTDA